MSESVVPKMSPGQNTELTRLVLNCQPSRAVRKQLGGITLLTLSGPTAIGKDTVLQKVGVPRVIAFTTKPPRPGQKEGIDRNFLPNSPACYDNLIDLARTGGLVQLERSPEGFIYGTMPKDYTDKVIPGVTKPVLVMDIGSEGAVRMRDKGFQNTMNIFLTAKPNDWRARLEQRIGYVDMASRYGEAVNASALAQNDRLFVVVDNSDGLLEAATTTVKSLCDAATRNPIDDSLARAVLNDFLLDLRSEDECV